MYIGINLEIDNKKIECNEALKNKYKKEKNLFESEINKYIREDKTLDGDKIISDWFPQFKTDVFISHSHNDLNLAIGIGEWLKNKFGLNVFIDSYVWGSADGLLKKIDDEYCLNDGQTSNYNYNKRNYSTSHVHNMLLTALMGVIDKTECVIFLNTEKSVVTTNDIKEESRTGSPWIYSEIMMTKLLRRKNRSEHRPPTSYSNKINENLEILYRLQLDHLYKLSIEDLKKLNNVTSNKYDALDDLYRMIEEQYILCEQVN